MSARKIAVLAHAAPLAVPVGASVPSSAAAGRPNPAASARLRRVAVLVPAPRHPDPDDELRDLLRDAEKIVQSEEEK